MYGSNKSSIIIIKTIKLDLGNIVLTGLNLFFVPAESTWKYLILENRPFKTGIPHDCRTYMCLKHLQESHTFSNDLKYNCLEKFLLIF